MNRYLIPRRITQRWEIIPGSGWGWAEIGVAAVGLLVGGVLLGLAWLLRAPLWLLALLLILPTGAGVGVAQPMPVTGESGLVMLQQMRQYFQSRRLYLYDIGRDDV